MHFSQSTASYFGELLSENCIVDSLWSLFFCLFVCLFAGCGDYCSISMKQNSCKNPLKTSTSGNTWLCWRNSLSFIRQNSFSLNYYVMSDPAN